MEYYRMFDDTSLAGRWYLGDVNVDDVTEFTNGESVRDGAYKDLEIEIDQDGIPLDLTESDGDWVPIVTEAFAECLFEYMKEVQLIPVSVQGKSQKYYVLVVKNKIDCVDEVRSEFEKYEADDEIWPERVGDYQSINVLKVDVSKIDKHIFRLNRYVIFMIVSGELKEQIESAGLTGIKFKLVS